MRATENDEDIWTRCCRRILVRISRKLPRVAKAEVPLRSERRGVSGFSRCIQLVPGSSRWWGLMGKHVVYRERRTGNHDLRVSTRANRIGRTAGIMPRERFARGLFQFNAQLLASRLAPRFLSSSRSARLPRRCAGPPLHMRALPSLWPGCWTFQNNSNDEIAFPASRRRRGIIFFSFLSFLFWRGEILERDAIGENWIGSDDWTTIDLVYVDRDGNWMEYRENLYSLAIDGAA